MNPNPHIQRHHHITLNVGDTQQDYDFHTKVLGLKSIKKTALYDGDVPIFHLYYGNDNGDESTLITCFPMRQSGRMGRAGRGQIQTLSLSVPVASLDYWTKRLLEHGFSPKRSDRFGETAVAFAHPCGIGYELVGVAKDGRKPATMKGEVPLDHRIRGTHGITVSVQGFEEADEFMQFGWNGKQRQSDGQFIRYALGEGGTGTLVDFRRQPELAPGSWTYGEGTVHHCAFQVKDLDAQAKVKFHLEGLGFTDVSERKDRGYFDSVYVRTPAGALFEATVSKSTGFLIDETFENLGKALQIPPVFASRKDELVKFLGPLPKD